MSKVVVNQYWDKQWDVCILALDPGTAVTGYSVLMGNKKTADIKLDSFGVLKTSKWADKAKEEKIDVRERIDALGADVRKLLTQNCATHLAIEDFVEQGKFVGKTFKEMAFLTEHLRLLGRELGVDVAIFENGVWKRQLMKASRVSKIQVQHYISYRLPEVIPRLQKQQDHVWDSIGIGLCLWRQLLLKES